MENAGTRLLQMRGAIFDVDGTLLDSMPMWHNIDVVYAARKGFVLTPEMTRDLDMQHLSECARYFRERCGVRESEDEIVREILALAAEGYANDVPEVPGAKALLAGMKRHGMRVALATASDLDALEPALRRLGLMRQVDLAESCDTVGVGKSRPDVYLRCAERLGVAPGECAVFEDALYALRTAKDAGFFTVAVLFGEHDPAERAAMASLADLAVEDLRASAAAFV